jgi:GNAT superfamily N-acetyltransferase
MVKGICAYNDFYATAKIIIGTNPFHIHFMVIGSRKGCILMSSLQIRSVQMPTEIEARFRLNAQVFRPDEDPERVAAQRQRFLVQKPDFRLEQLRGAFVDDGTLVGGYNLLERTMCLGPARLRTGCINGVMTHPDYRHQGIASALMHDAINIAERKHYALLFLHGIGNFYQQFGYTDVLEDTPHHFLNRQQLPDPTLQACVVRAATAEDVPAILACYQRHYSPYLGSFAPLRTHQRQAHVLFNWFEVQDGIKPLVAVDAEQKLQGYLLLSRRRGRLLYAYEVAADTWSAALALLHAHSQLLDAEPNPPTELDWPLPPTDPTFYLLAQHLPVRSQQFAIPNAGWMARPAYLPTLLQSLLPLWQQHWQERSRLIDWSGTFALTIDDHTNFLEITPAGIQFIDRPSSSPLHITLSSSIFTQLIFAFRPISWVQAQREQRIPEELVPILNVLFPSGQAWIAGSDYF